MIKNIFLFILIIFALIGVSALKDGYLGIFDNSVIVKNNSNNKIVPIKKVRIPSIYSGDKSYSKNSDNSVKDNYTKLIWQKSGSDIKLNWDDAKAYCNELTLDEYSDWRLPSIEELYSLVDITKTKPAIDSNYFHIESSGWYWSATTYQNDSTNAWLVIFKRGADYFYLKSSKYYALCVRSEDK